MNWRQTNDRSAPGKAVRVSLCLAAGLFSWLMGTTALQAATSNRVSAETIQPQALQSYLEKQPPPLLKVIMPLNSAMLRQAMATKHAMCTMETDLYNQYKNEPLMADTIKDLEKDARKLGVSPAGPIVPLPNMATFDMGHKISYYWPSRYLQDETQKTPDIQRFTCKILTKERRKTALFDYGQGGETRQKMESRFADAGKVIDLAIKQHTTLSEAWQRFHSQHPSSGTAPGIATLLQPPLISFSVRITPKTLAQGIVDHTKCDIQSLGGEADTPANCLVNDVPDALRFITSEHPIVLESWLRYPGELELTASEVIWMEAAQ
jgi:hypothetical protein